MKDAVCRPVSCGSAFDVPTMRFNEEPFEQRYEIAEELGNGQFAVVRRVINHSTGEQFAAKFIKKRRYATSRRGVTRCNIEREVDVLQVVGGHEFTIKLYDIYETPSDVILVLELVSGGELFDHVSAKECLDESEAAAFIQQILFALKHLHDNHVVHLDIKPENVMLRKRGEPKIKLIDFGLSRRILPGTIVKDMIGTPEFVAPEVVNYEPLSPATDMWALGVVTYILLSGGSPFLGETRDETFVNISAVNYHFNERYFEHISSYAKDFISRLFVRDQRKRANVDECLRHPWIRGPDGVSNNILQHSVISMAQMRSFKIRLKWRRAVDVVIACNRMTANARFAIRKASEAGRSINSRYDPDELIVSAMLIACEEGNLAGLDQLAVLHRINLNIANRMGETAMHVGAGAGQFDVVHYLHMKGAASDACDRRGETPLFWAARNGHANIINYFTNDENININAINKSKESALHVATRYAQLESVLLLLEHGADPSLQDEHGETALHIASWHGYAALLGALCRFNPPLNFKNQEQMKRSEAVQNNIARQKDDDEKGGKKTSYSNENDGYLHGDNHIVTTITNTTTTAISSTIDCFTTTAPFTTTATATINCTTSTTSTTTTTTVITTDKRRNREQDNRTALPFAIRRFHPSESISTGKETIRTSTSLFHSFFASSPPRLSIPPTVIESNNLNLEELNNPVTVARSNFTNLIARFASISFNNTGSKSLRNWSNHSFGESANFSSENETSPCSCMTHQSRQKSEANFDTGIPETLSVNVRPLPCTYVTPMTNKFVALITDMDQDWDQYCGCAADDETALHCAAARGHVECVQSLLDVGAPVDAIDQNGQTALHLALRRSHIDIALLLITKGCKLDVQDEKGDTALHIAARIGLLAAVQTLCHLGALVDIPNQNSLTPLHLAAKEGHIEIVRCLCLFGANVIRKNKDGLTAEIIALAQEHTQIGSLLAKMKSEQTRDFYVEQLCPLEIPLRRIKLKIFGHAGVGKTRLICALQSAGMIGSIIGAMQRRFSDNPSPSSSSTTSSPSQDEGINSLDDSMESNNNTKSSRGRRAPHSQYTRGIDVQNINVQGCGEFSVWEFGGYESYHMAYDHFVGNTDCVHVIVYRCTDPTEIQYKQVLYWMNFLKGRVTPSEPIGHCGIISRRSKVVIIGSHATSALYPQRNSDGDYVSSDSDAMLKTVRLRFETHFDIHDQLILLDSTQNNCPGMKSLKIYLSKARDSILSRLQKPLGLLDTTMQYIAGVRKQHAHFPVITWPHFTSWVRNEVNPLAGDNHCRQLIQQLQLIGEVVYLRDEVSELDYVVLSSEWLGTHVLGNLLSAEFLSRCRMNGCYSIDDFAPFYPEIAEPADLLRILDTLQLCAPTDSNGEAEFEFPAFNVLDAPKDIWQRDRPTYVYGGLRILPMRGMERSLQSTFPRIQVALRRSMHDFQDPMDADLMQWNGCSKMSSGQMEALIRLHGDAVEIQVRGPCEIATSCFYFLEDITNLVEQTAQEVAPGISLERHFLSPKHLREHVVNPAVYAPETIMAMQQAESLIIRNNQESEELFTDVVCFGSREVAAVLTLGIDVGVAQLQLTSRCELAALLDPADAMGRDWSILAVKLNLTDQLPEVDSTGQSLSRTDQLLAEWALQCPETATVGRLCTVLEELGRQDARDALYRTVPLYLFAPLDEQPAVHLTECGDSGVVSSTQSTTDPRSASTLSR